MKKAGEIKVIREDSKCFHAGTDLREITLYLDKIAQGRIHRIVYLPQELLQSEHILFRDDVSFHRHGQGSDVQQIHENPRIPRKLLVFLEEFPVGFSGVS